LPVQALPVQAHRPQLAVASGPSSSSASQAVATAAAASDDDDDYDPIGLEVVMSWSADEWRRLMAKGALSSSTKQPAASMD